MEANFYALLGNLAQLFVMVAATWRMTSLVCNEEGPFAVFEKNRQFFRHLHKTKAWFRATHLYNGIRCEWCTSIWVAFPFLAMYLLFPTETLVYATALTFSTGTIFLKYIVQTLNAVKERQEGLTRHLDKIEAEPWVNPDDEQPGYPVEDYEARIAELEETLETVANTLHESTARSDYDARYAAFYMAATALDWNLIAQEAEPRGPDIQTHIITEQAERIASLEKELTTIASAIADAKLQGADVPETIYVQGKLL